MKNFEIVAPGPLMPLILDQLAARFTLHRLWEAPDPQALLTAVGPRARACVAGGSVRCDAELMRALPALEIIANFGVGYDGVDAAFAASHGVIVTNTPDVLTEEVADTALGLLLMTARELSAAERWLRAGRWAKEGPYRLTPGTLRGKTLGIVGLGRIGKAIAKRCEAFGLTIVYHGRRAQADAPYRFYPSLIEMARAVDILMAVAPGGPDTFHMIDAQALAALGPSGILINVGRGSVVDEQALIEALRAGTIFSAGLDVFEDEPHVPAELIAMDRIVLLPHVGSASTYTRQLMGQLVVDNLNSWAEGRGPLTPVAETPWPARQDADVMQ